MASAAAEGTLYVTGLPSDVNEDQVRHIFGQYGQVTALKVLPPHPSKPDGAATVTMETMEKAQWVVDNINGTAPVGLPAPLTVALKRKGWGKGYESTTSPDTLYVSGLPKNATDETVTALFQQYGPVKSCKVMNANAERQDAAAIVSMASAEQAKMLIENVSGTVPAGYTAPITIKAKLNNSWAKGWGKGFLPTNDPWAMMQMFFMQKGMGMKGKGKGKFGSRGGGLSSFPADRKVWVGNLPEGITFKELQEHFGGQEKAKFAAVWGKGADGTGGVAFATPEEATAAIQSLNGSMLSGSAIVVDVWTKKESAPPVGDIAADGTQAF